MEQHPSLRFKAPVGIQAGVPLKNVINKSLICLLAESMANVVGEFNVKQFQKEALSGLDELEFSARGLHIAHALAAHLPSNIDMVNRLLVKAMGPELTATENNGLGVFFYLPHAYVIAEYGVKHFNSGMQANYELTKRMTAEFSIRPFIIRYQKECFEKLMLWTQDSNPHVRRLVSEGTRPRLPWAMRLKEVQNNPQLTIPLLEILKDDIELYVRRSVANHLGDIIKDNPDIGFDVAEKWLEDTITGNLNPSQAEARRWLIRHALRLPAKKGHKRALTIRQSAGKG
jgi:3-methyladenine DNA glycosylase AlkC